MTFSFLCKANSISKSAIPVRFLLNQNFQKLLKFLCVLCLSYLCIISDFATIIRNSNMKINLRHQTPFQNRHNASMPQTAEMLQAIGVDSLETLIAQTIPDKIRLKKPLQLPQPQTEAEFLKSFKKLAQKNQVFKSCIGMGYYDTFTPPVILRNILENPGWYTAYTPYQAEIAQGRLEMLLNFQTLVMDLTGMEIANASLLDEATAAAEALHLMHAQRPAEKQNAHVFFVSEKVHPQTIELLRTRSAPVGVELLIGDHKSIDLTNENIFGMLLQCPATDGTVEDYTNLIETAHELNLLVAVATDLLALTLLKPPGEMGADVVVGSAQRFGVPLGYGGPHAAFFATREAYKRNLPGRLIGVSVDAQGNRALRMALQTREQHIRREKATSNICTAQVLLSVMAAAYAVYHGPEGLRKIAERVYGLTELLSQSLEKMGLEVLNKEHFDTLVVLVKENEEIRKMAESNHINFRYINGNRIGISLDETSTVDDVENILEIFAESLDLRIDFNVQKLADKIELALPENIRRQSGFLTQQVFNSHHSEHEMLRYLKMLENKDLSMVHSMIPLGSCTMKLNATAEMIPVTWQEFGGIHPFAPVSQAEGYQELFGNLEKWLCEVTGFAAISLQPNSGAQGEYAGLMCIRAYHLSRGDAHRNIALIPASAHGTNPASAVMAGMKVVVTKTDPQGNVDIEDLRQKAEQYKENLAALMVTYPSTHGVFEENIQEICEIIHRSGG
jgi:glycine dehydrogenase